MCWIEFFCLFFFPARRIIGFPSSCWFHFSCLASRKMRDSISRKCTQPALLLLQCCCCVHYFVKTDGPVNISLSPNHLIVSGTIFRALLLYFGSTFFVLLFSPFSFHGGVTTHNRRRKRSDTTVAARLRGRAYLGTLNCARASRPPICVAGGRRRRIFGFVCVTPCVVVVVYLVLLYIYYNLPHVSPHHLVQSEKRARSGRLTAASRTQWSATC
jgi:hypothetical protein